MTLKPRRILVLFSFFLSTTAILGRGVAFEAAIVEQLAERGAAFLECNPPDGATPTSAEDALLRAAAHLEGADDGLSDQNVYSSN
jgi:hypothetical protein